MLGLRLRLRLKSKLLFFCKVGKSEKPKASKSQVSLLKKREYERQENEIEQPSVMTKSAVGKQHVSRSNRDNSEEVARVRKALISDNYTVNDVKSGIKLVRSGHLDENVLQQFAEKIEKLAREYRITSKLNIDILQVLFDEQIVSQLETLWIFHIDKREVIIRKKKKKL